MSETVVGADTRCSSCDQPLKPTALFCTSCGTKRAQEAPTEGRCGACGSALKPNAAFCTDCGSAAPVQLREAHTRRVADINPAASRAILESVAGGRGGYVGSGAPRPQPTGTFHGDDRDGHDGPETATGPSRRRRAAIVLGAAAMVLVLAGLGVLLLTGGGDDGSLEASGSDPTTASTAAPASSSAPTGPDAAPAVEAAGKKAAEKQAEEKKKAEKKAADEKKAAEAEKAAAEAEAAEKAAAEAREADEQRRRDDEARRAAAGQEQTPAVPGAPRAPNTVARPGSGGPVLAAPASVVIPVSGPAVAVIRNDGNANLSWNASIVWGGTQPGVSPRSGTLAPGQSAQIQITWPGSQNPSGTGRLDIAVVGGGSKYVQLRR